MQIVNVIQGSSEWHQARETHFCASDAPAMMGASKNKSRADLLKEKAAGITEAVTPFVQSLYDAGHAAEASIRPYIASVIGDELFPVVGEDGRLLASLDGITMDDETIFEHKIWNEDLATQIEVGELTPHSYWQLEHQLLVSGAKRVIFVCSDGTPEKCVHMEYTAVPGRAETLQAGWDLFDKDLCAYSAPAADPIVEKKALMALPALSVQLVGKVTTSNLPAYRDSALEFIGKINTDLKTDQDFADAEQTVKFCEDAEKNLQFVKDQAIAQTATIDELFRALDQISDAMRQKRLMLEKLVKSRKETIKAEIVTAGRNAWNAHVSELNRLLGRVSVTVLMPDFGTAIKGKRTLASLRDAVDSALTTAKIAATQQRELFASRLAIIDEVAKDHGFLVRDLAALVAMPTETLSAVIKERISAYQAEQDRKAEADRVRRENEATARREAEEREAAAKTRREEEAARIQRESVERARQTAPVAPVSIPGVTPFTLPVEQPAAPSVAPGGAPAGQPAAVAGTTPTRMRPKASVLVGAIAAHFSVTTDTALQWLRSTDFSKTSEAA